MQLLATYTNEMEALLLTSRLKGAGIDNKMEVEGTDVFKIMVFEDDVAEAQEVIEALQFDDDDIGDDFDDVDFADFADDEDDD